MDEGGDSENEKLDQVFDVLRGSTGHEGMALDVGVLLFPLLHNVLHLRISLRRDFGIIQVRPHHNHRRGNQPAQSTQLLEPVFTSTVKVTAQLENSDVEGAVREEELMRRVEHFLPAKVIHEVLDSFGDSQWFHIDPIRRDVLGIISFVKTVDQMCFPNILLSHDDKLDSIPHF